jgi:dienelactone hydrolase
MKSKALVILLALLLAGCNSSSQSSSDVKPVSDFLIESFETEGSFLSNSTYTLSSSIADEGKGLCFAPSFSTNVLLDRTLEINPGSYSYLRCYINNKTSEALSISLTLNNVSLSSPSFSLVNGKEYNPTSNSLEAGFEGWVSYYLDTSIKEISTLKYVLNDSSMIDGESICLDSVVLTNSLYGQTRYFAFKEGSNDTMDEKKAYQEKVIQETLGVTPVYQVDDSYAPSSSWDGIKGITFRGANRGDKRTKVFAYFGLPSEASETNKVPAIVLVHGGGGHPFLEWIQQWNNRGYAAIAFDTTGYFPTASDAGSSETDTHWAHDLGIYAEEGYTNGPDLDDMANSDKPLDEQWMFHAIIGTILSHNIIKSLKEVDSSKVGIMGISWGGVITSLAIGYDTSYAFAIPVYGSAYLDEALSYMSVRFGSEATKALWLAQDHLDNAKMPILYQGWNADNNFSINSNSKSYLQSKKNNAKTTLSMVNGMLHSHSMAWGREEPFVFASSVVKNSLALPSFSLEPTLGNNGEISGYEGYAKITAKVYYLTEKLTYTPYPNTTMINSWNNEKLEFKDGKIAGDIPLDAYQYYIEIKAITENDEQYVVTSPFINVTD